MNGTVGKAKGRLLLQRCLSCLQSWVRWRDVCRKTSLRLKLRFKRCKSSQSNNKTGLPSFATDHSRRCHCKLTYALTRHQRSIHCESKHVAHVASKRPWGPQTTRDTPEPNREKPSITKLDRTRYEPLRANAAYLAAEGLVAEMRLRVLSQGGLDGERFMAGRALVRPFLGVDPDVTYQVARFLELLGDWTELQWDFEHFIPGSRSLLSIENGGPLYVTIASDHFDRSVESAHCVDVNNRAHYNVTNVRRMYGFLKNLNQKSDHRLTHFKLQHSQLLLRTPQASRACFYLLAVHALVPTHPVHFAHLPRPVAAHAGVSHVKAGYDCKINKQKTRRQLQKTWVVFLNFPSLITCTKRRSQGHSSFVYVFAFIIWLFWWAWLALRSLATHLHNKLQSESATKLYQAEKGTWTCRSPFKKCPKPVAKDTSRCTIDHASAVLFETYDADETHRTDAASRRPVRVEQRGWLALRLSREVLRTKRAAFIG